MSLKVGVILNMAPHYRAGIYPLLESSFECDWYFSKGFNGIKELPLSFFKRAQYIPMRYIMGKSFYIQKGLIRILMSKKYDLILTCGEINSLSFWWLLFVHRIFGVGPKVYDWGHGMLRVRKWPRRWIEKFFYKMIDGFFVCGERAIDNMISVGISPSKLYLVHNSLDYDNQLPYRGNFSKIYINHFGNSDPVLYFIGRLTRIKKLHMVLDAMKILQEDGMNLNLVLVGEGNEKENLLARVKELNMCNRVWFYGACYNEEEKSELIANADICVAPGNIGLTAMDSLMYGTPAITMDNYGVQMPEHAAIKDGLTGCFFKENDVYDLAKQIKNWLTNGKSREVIRAACYKEIDESWNPHYQIEVFKKYLLP